MLRCPNNDGDLEERSFRDLSLQVCDICGGVWYQQDELGQFLKDCANFELPPDYQIVPSKTVPSDVPSNTPHNCPFDQNQLDKFEYAYDSKVYIERCDLCGGIFIDGNKIQEILDYLKPKPELEDLGKAFLDERKSVDDLRKTVRDAPFILLAPLFLIPYTDTVQRKYFPWLTFFLVLINVIIFGVLTTDTTAQQFGFISTSTFIPQAFYRLLTYIFVHESWAHVLSNMLFLWVFGRSVEDKLGKIKYAFIFLISGVASALMFALFNHIAEPLVGASGAISGILGAYLVLFPGGKVKAFSDNIFVEAYLAQNSGSFNVEVSAWYYIGAWFLLQFFMATVYSSLQVVPQIAFWGHVGGFICGLLLTLWLFRPKTT